MKFSRHPLGVHDLILPMGIMVASFGHFYSAMALWLLWGWLNKRRAVAYRGAVMMETLEPPPVPESRPNIHDFQERGESLRQRLGIDGTAGDAQDVEHPYIPEVASGPCLVCGLNRTHRRHFGVSVPAHTPGPGLP